MCGGGIGRRAVRLLSTQEGVQTGVFTCKVQILTHIIQAIITTVVSPALTRDTQGQHLDRLLYGEGSSIGRAGINESCIRFLQQCFSWTCNPRVVGSNPTPRHWLCLAIQGSLCVHGADNLHKKISAPTSEVSQVERHQHKKVNRRDSCTAILSGGWHLTFDS